jgi:poly-gamma-glutamate synthesis protein (capsule biosynthesis protein)
MGDIMGHGPQIRAAWQDSSQAYNYQEVFSPLKKLISSVDFAVANLEVTLAGAPYDGYPQFSSPDNLAITCKESGIDVLVTANNHSCDRGSAGIIRTVEVLDSLSILHTGTFKNDKKRDSLNLLILEKEGIKVGLLNYTYGTNGMPFNKPSYVNLLDSSLIKKDVLKAKSQTLDKLIIYVHWGAEYQDFPNRFQKNYNKFFNSLGVDVVIGSHPHVIQPMIYQQDSTTSREFLTIYSLGNFVSNQRERRKDGGVMFRLSFRKTNNITKIHDKEYLLTWVNKYKTANKTHYQILPCDQEMYDSNFFNNEEQFKSMTTFINDSRIHLSNNNVEINEGIYFPKITISPVPLEPIDLKSSHRKIRAFKLSIKRRRIFSRENRISLKKQRHKPKVSKG